MHKWTGFILVLATKTSATIDRFCYTNRQYYWSRCVVFFSRGFLGLCPLCMPQLIHLIYKSILHHLPKIIHLGGIGLFQQIFGDRTNNCGTCCQREPAVPKTGQEGKWDDSKVKGHEFHGKPCNFMGTTMGWYEIAGLRMDKRINVITRLCTKMIYPRHPNTSKEGVLDIKINIYIYFGGPSTFAGVWISRANIIRFSDRSLAWLHHKVDQTWYHWPRPRK